MKFQKKVSAENRVLLKKQFDDYKKEVSMSREELRELTKWVLGGNSPYDNGDYIYTEYGVPMDFISALRFQKEHLEWLRSLPADEQENVARKLRGEYDTASDDVVFCAAESDYAWLMDPDEELPFD